MFSKLLMIAAPALMVFGAVPLADSANPLPADDHVVMFIADEDVAWDTWYEHIESQELTNEPICLYEGEQYQPENVFGMRYMIAECVREAYYPDITPNA